MLLLMLLLDRWCRGAVAVGLVAVPLVVVVRVHVAVDYGLVDAAEDCLRADEAPGCAAGS